MPNFQKSLHVHIRARVHTCLVHSSTKTSSNVMQITHVHVCMHAHIQSTRTHTHAHTYQEHDFYQSKTHISIDTCSHTHTHTHQHAYIPSTHTHTHTHISRAAFLPPHQHAHLSFLSSPRRPPPTSRTFFGANSACFAPKKYPAVIQTQNQKDSTLSLIDIIHGGGRSVASA